MCGGHHGLGGPDVHAEDDVSQKARAEVREQAGPAPLAPHTPLGTRAGTGAVAGHGYTRVLSELHAVHGQHSRTLLTGDRREALCACSTDSVGSLCSD